MSVLTRLFLVLLLAGGNLLATASQSAPATPTGSNDAADADLGTTWHDLLSWTERKQMLYVCPVVPAILLPYSVTGHRYIHSGHEGGIGPNPFAAPLELDLLEDQS